MSPEQKKYSFDFLKLVVVVVASGLVSWFSNKLAIQSQFADFKEELHTYMAEEKIINNVASKDIENVKLDLKDYENKVNEIDKDVNLLLALYRKQIKKEEE